MLDTRQTQLLVRDPFRDANVTIAGRSVPLGANFTAPYGLWLTRSGLTTQSLRSLLGRKGGIREPRVISMQPWDPNRLTVVMLHGLAAAPRPGSTWRTRCWATRSCGATTVWQVYYPANAPIAVNLMQIRRALDATIRHFDPDGTTRATQHMMLVGHSMGGVIARLLVSSSGDKLWSMVPEQGRNLSANATARHRH
ncbi:esterase/lipase family protein [Rhodanobacter lindaniclasticus]